MADFFERIVILKRAPIFTEVSTDDVRVVVEQMQEELYFKGEHVFDIADPPDRMYVVLTGKIGISLHQDPKVADYVGTVGPGECFGEMGPIDGQPRSGSAHVLEDARLLWLDKLKLHGLIASYPELGLGLMRGISMRLRSAGERIAALQQASRKT